MDRRMLVLLGVCLCLLAFGGRASADLIIDENFDANPLIDSQGSIVPVTMMMAGMWFHHMMAPFGAWRYERGHVVGMAMDMMAMDAWWRTLTYFVAMPRGGWGDEGLVFTFDYEYSTAAPSQTGAMFGVYGWDDGDVVYLDSRFPGRDGTELIAQGLEPFANNHNGLMPAGGPLEFSAAAGWGTAGGTYLGDLSGFPFIGVTFTFGVEVGSAEPPLLRIDEVELAVIPEPATIVLGAIGMGMAARALRRKRMRRGAAGPPG